ncbi:MAG: VWA domain-containing protein [Verrucomicrobiota bacterium]
MTETILQFLAGGEALPEGSREWMLSTEGLSAGWAFFIFLLVGAGAVWGYVQFAPGVSRFWRTVLTALRLITIALLLILLTQPILNLTINEPVRQALLVLVDGTQSMLLNDRRTTPEDLKRASIAAGLLAPDAGLEAAVPSGADSWKNKSRWELLQTLAGNEQINLWQRLADKSDLYLHQFGKDTVQVMTLQETEETGAPDIAQVKEFFAAAEPQETVTALGESLRQLLEQYRGWPVSGILLITDGASNSGLPPVEAARLAREQSIPLFVYGVGVTEPVDLVAKTLTAPQIGFLEERMEVTAKFDTAGLGPRTIRAVLRADGQEVDSQTIDVREDGSHELVFGFEPAEVGEVNLEATFQSFPEEISEENNTVSAKTRIVDKKINVLYIEQEPRWDFRYLLDLLQRDRRLLVKCIMIDGEPGLEKIEESPFLPELPETKEDIFKYEIIILGDVDPKDLGPARMELLKEWVADSNGGLIFLAGGKHNPRDYVGTPLEDLLPIVPDVSVTSDAYAERVLEPFKLELTPAGEDSSYLRMTDDFSQNLDIWEKFPGVRWTAAVTRAKPGAEILITDSRVEKSRAGRRMPVMALQGYGSGETVFIGTDETYRWRSRKGEEHYSQVWNSIMQSLALKRLQGASARTQLKANRERYFVGDKVVISGKVYDEDFEPITAPTLEGKIDIKGLDADGQESDRTIRLDVTAVANERGEFQGEFTAKEPGLYTYSSFQDPEAVVKFEVVEAKIEQLETALNERLLASMADTAKGVFLREENLDTLPEKIAEQSATVATFKKIELYYSPWWLVLILTTLFLEWLLRRLLNLK